MKLNLKYVSDEIGESYKEWKPGNIILIDAQTGTGKKGISIAKQEGKYKGRKKIESDKFEKIYKEWKADNITGIRAMELLGMKRNTFYRRVAEHEA